MKKKCSNYSIDKNTSKQTDPRPYKIRYEDSKKSYEMSKYFFILKTSSLIVHIYIIYTHINNEIAYLILLFNK